MSGKYDGIINLSHHVSTKRPKMSMYDRAAQFSPFAALTGHDEAIEETARLTDEKLEVDEKRKSILNDKLHIICENIRKKPLVTVTYFMPDKLKTGGAYVTVSGFVKRLDITARLVTMHDRTVIPLDDVLELEGEIFKDYIAHPTV